MSKLIKFYNLNICILVYVIYTLMKVKKKVVLEKFVIRIIISHLVIPP